MTKQIPKYWQMKKLGEVCDIKSSKRVHKVDWREKGVPFYRAREIVKLAENGFVNNVLFISKNLFEEFTKLNGSPKEGDIVVSAVGTLGRCYRVKKEDKFYFKDASVLWFDNFKNINSKYVEYLFLSELVKKQVMNKSMGATVGTLTITRAKNIQIPLPPLPEQIRITKILDETFGKLEIAKKNAEKNLKNAKELFESYLQGVFENGGDDFSFSKATEDRWEKKTLGEVIDFFNGYAFKSKNFVKESNTQIIRMGNLYQNKLDLNRHAVFYPDNISNKLKNYILIEDDLIISLTGTTDKEDYGYTVQVPLSNKTLLLNQRIAKIIVLDKEKTLKDFLLYLLLSRTFLDKLYKTANGTRQANLSTVTMKGILVNFPKSLQTQQKIVKKLDYLSTNTKKLEKIYQQKLDDLDELKKSLLQKAFEGKL